MFDERPEAGTDAPPADPTEVEVEDAGEGAPGSDDGAPESEKKVSITSHEYVTLKAAREKQKALEEEVARLKAATAIPPTTDTRETGADARQKAIEKRERHMAQLREARDKGDEASDILLSALEQVQESEERTVYRLQMADIPEAERKDVQSFMQQHGIKFPAVARRIMRGDRYETLEQENARLKAELDKVTAAKGRKVPAVEDTRIIGSPGGSRGSAPKKGAPITLAEYNERMRKDPAATTAARKAGEFTIKVD